MALPAWTMAHDDLLNCELEKGSHREARGEARKLHGFQFGSALNPAAAG